MAGSGYGGAIAASWRDRAGRQVYLLERGKKLRPGEYYECCRPAYKPL